ncbi:uncharacterized protein LOC142350529 [Convolutriloba macropyga]|uniref:uncharacterized protein LOC142350529 n=1 Tax=Convolutriloba macropyga TaxID=536237 RepID=UPI003F5238A1
MFMSLLSIVILTMVPNVIFMSKIRATQTIVQFDSQPEEINLRSLTDFAVDTFLNTDTATRCGLQCTKHDYCKSYNHNEHWAICELIITDYRLLDLSTVDGISSFGWRHYSKVNYPRGCVGKSAPDCVRLWVNITLTSDVSITCEWTLADTEEGTEFLLFTVSNAEHFNQQGVAIPSDTVIHSLDRPDRHFEVIGADIPGVHYHFTLSQMFRGNLAQFLLFANESTYPAEILELSHLRVVTEHTLEVHWVFQGTAQFVDIWNEPVGGSCPCTLNAIGTFSLEITNLEAGRNYTFYIQLTSAYGKKGVVTSFKVATYTDEIDNSTTVGTDDLVLFVDFESGTGSEVELQITGQLSGIDRIYFFSFALSNVYHFGDLDPGDLYTISMKVTSLGDVNTAVNRSYTFYDSTYPIEPTIFTTVTVTEHTMHFGWTNPVHFQKVYVWHEPSEGSCPCDYNNQSPNYATISGLIAGEEYRVHILAESAFGRNSSRLSFVQSLYTDVVVISNDLQTHRIQTDVQFESGLGSTVTMELICQDLPLNWKQKKAFQLQLSFAFTDIIPGSAYSWQVLSESRGSNPLKRQYDYSGYTYPMVPVSMIKAAATLDDYDTFTFTVGNQPFTEGSTTTIQFTWAQERRIEAYSIKDVTNNRHLSTHVIATSGWTLHDTTALSPGTKYTFEVTSISHGLTSSEVMTIEDSTHPLPPEDNPNGRIVGTSELTMAVQYSGPVQALKVSLFPSEGNCASGCTFNAPSTTTIQLTGLTPGKDYNISLSTESNQKESKETFVTQGLHMGQIIAFRTINLIDQVTIEFQIDEGVGSEIIVDYVGRYVGHTNTSTFPFKLFNRLVLNYLRPSESYDMTLTLKGQGQNYNTRVKTFEAHLYPADIAVLGMWSSYHDIRLQYQTFGNFSVMEVSVEPEDSQCPCQIYTQDGTGYITLGDSSHYLMSGGEYFITLRSSSYVGRLSSPTFLVTSLLVGRIIATNNRVEGGMAKYDVEIASGIGSFIRMTISDEGIDPVDTVMEVSVEPEDSHCRCQIYTQDGTGYITLGDSSHYLMSGGEYFITLRSSSYVGRLSSPTFLVTSLLVGRIIATNKRVECGMVKYDVEIASGIGSFIRMTISDEGIDPVDTVVEEINFSFHVQKSVAITVGQCLRLYIEFYSKGSKPTRTTGSFLLTPLPLTPSLSTGAKFSIFFVDGDKSLTFFFFIDPNLAFERLDIEFRLNGGYIRGFYFDHDEMDGRRRRPDGTFSYWAASTLRHDVGTTYDLVIFSKLCGSVGDSLLMTATIT